MRYVNARRPKLPLLQHRRLETRLVMVYKVVAGTVPAINADEFLNYC